MNKNNSLFVLAILWFCLAAISLICAWTSNYLFALILFSVAAGFLIVAGALMLLIVADSAEYLLTKSKVDTP